MNQRKGEPKNNKYACQQIYVPSWAIEKKYSPGPLVYNWSEERHHRFNHEDVDKPFPVSVTTHDYPVPCNIHFNNRDRIRSLVVQQRGSVPSNLLLRHHEKWHNCNRITWYDEIYNRRRFTDKHGQMRFPSERKWVVPEKTWSPEQSDYPLQGDSTNWGLKEKLAGLEAAWHADIKDAYSSTYSKSYSADNSYSSKPGYGEYNMNRYATPRELSFKYNQQDRVNQDTDFAHGKQPERLWHIDKSSGLCEPRNPQLSLYD